MSPFAALDMAVLTNLQDVELDRKKLHIEILYQEIFSSSTAI
jgi:hypothetical protein